MRLRRGLFLMLLVPALLVPVLAGGEVIRLRDQSTLNGRLVKVDGDSLTIRLTVGPHVRVHRSQVLSIVFDEAAGSLPAASAPAMVSPAVTAPVGEGTLEIAFKDRDVSSKISIEKKKDWDSRQAGNHLVLELLVDGRIVSSVTDTTMDKTIYQGHTTQLKNEITIKDFGVPVPAGIHQFELRLRNRGADQFEDAFDPEPITMSLLLDNVEIRAGQTTRATVGIARGKMRMGQPKFYKVE